MFNLFKPTVTSAIATVEKAIRNLAAAEEAHLQRADKLRTQSSALLEVAHVLHARQALELECADDAKDLTKKLLEIVK